MINLESGENRSNSSKASDEDCLAILAKQCSDVSRPAYWNLIEENCTNWANEISGCPYWTTAKAKLQHWRTEFRSEFGSDLLVKSELPSFTSKGGDAIKSKVFRRIKESANNQIFLASGLPVPQIGDLVRTRISCRFIDGVEFLATKFAELARDMGLPVDRQKQGSISGYFAQHINVQLPVIYRAAGVTSMTEIKCEIQVASELATRMWDASHPLYEAVRSEYSKPEDWQWKPDDPRFISNQLGHMIHLADGLLVQLRNTSKKGLL